MQCGKCGRDGMLGPRYNKRLNKLNFVCSGCGFVLSTAPRDQLKGLKSMEELRDALLDKKKPEGEC